MLLANSLLLGRADLRAQERPPVEFNRSILNESSLDSLLRPLFINKLTDRYIAGAAIGVVYDGRLVYAKGFGDREVFSEDPVDASRTIFRIGSITKVLTGIAVMQLVDRGLVDLDAGPASVMPYVS
jgi:CubicO group peptidase (beta-lactamase class C family)